MGLGKRIQQLREETDTSLRLLGTITKIDPSTINRIENEVVSPTIETAITLLECLSLYPYQTYQALTTGIPNPNIPLYDKEDLLASSVPTWLDVNRIASFLQKNQEAGQIFLSDWLDKIFQAYYKDETKAKYFSPKVVEMLLQESSLYVFGLHYPSSISVEALINNYNQGGIIIREDVFNYFSNKMESREWFFRKNEVSPIELLKQLADVNRVRKIKLDDLIKADNYLEARGEFVVMVAKAVYFDMIVTMVPPKPDEVQIGRPSWGPRGFEARKYMFRNHYIFIIMSRWIEYLQLSLSDWLKEVRELTFDQAEDYFVIWKL